MSKTFVRNPKFRELPLMCPRCKVALIKEDKRYSEWKCPICDQETEEKEGD
tara:strand:- start:11553 stop:11705 length:153 start_codon:yes stop_codon:yes gene_type:complete